MLGTGGDVAGGLLLGQEQARGLDDVLGACLLYTSYQAGIKTLKDAGYYVIGRITAFNDPHLAEDHPECVIADPVSYTHLDVYKRQPICWIPCAWHT